MKSRKFLQSGIVTRRFIPDIYIEILDNFYSWQKRYPRFLVLEVSLVLWMQVFHAGMFSALALHCQQWQPPVFQLSHDFTSKVRTVLCGDFFFVFLFTHLEPCLDVSLFNLICLPAISGFCYMSGWYFLGILHSQFGAVAVPLLYLSLFTPCCEYLAGPNGLRCSQF